MTDHTPTPWTVTIDHDWLEHSCCHDAAITAFEDGKRRMLAEAHSPEDAAFIVKAVNSHDALVRELENAHCALKAMKEAVEASKKMNGREYINLGIQVNNAIGRAYDTLRAAVSSPGDQK